MLLRRSVLLALSGAYLSSLPAQRSWGLPVDTEVAPFGLHPDNPRYFQFRGQPAVLVTSAEHYGLLLNRPFDYVTYFRELASHGLNHTRVFSGAYREVASSFNITDNTLAPSHDNYICPWQRVAQQHPDGAPIFDLTQWDPQYFERLQAVVSAAGEQGIVIELTLFCPMYKPELWDVNPMHVRNNINGVGDCGSKQVYTLEQADLLQVQIALAQKLVAELLPHDNVYFEICNEPYFGGVTDAWQRRLIDAVVAAQREVGCRKLISVNVANKTQRVSDPHPALSLFNFHYCYPPSAVSDNAHLNLPIGENETGFRGREDFLYRTEGWDFMLAGGALYNNLDYSFSVAHPEGTLVDYRSPGGGSRALRQQLGILKRQLDRLPLPDVHSQPDLVSAASPELICSSLGKPAQAYLVYAHVKLPGKLKDEPLERYTRTLQGAKLTLQLPPGRYRVQQIHTLHGSQQPLPEVESTGAATALQLAEFQTDVALYVEALPAL